MTPNNMKMMVMMVMEVMLLPFAFFVIKGKFPNGSRVRSKPNKEKDGDVTCFSSNKEIWLRSKIRSKPKKEEEEEDDGGGGVVVVASIFVYWEIMKFD